jgi:hypothetical protein
MGAEMTALAAAAATATVIIEPEKRSSMIRLLFPLFRGSRWPLMTEGYTNFPRLRKTGVMAGA